MNKGVKALIIIGSIVAVGVGGFFGVVLLPKLKHKVNKTQWESAINYIHNTENRNVKINIQSNSTKNKYVDIYCKNEKEWIGTYETNSIYARKNNGIEQRYSKDSNGWTNGNLFTNDYDGEYMPAHLKDLENKFSNFKFKINGGWYDGTINGKTYRVSFNEQKQIEDVTEYAENDAGVKVYFDYNNLEVPSYFPN